MNSLKYLIFFSIFFLLSCQSKEKIEVLEISKATYKGKTILGNRSIFKKTLSNPFSKLDTCNRTLIGIKQGYWVYDCIVPSNDKHATYSTYQDVVFLSRLTFSSPEEKIIAPKITLSSKTTLADIKNLFPKSYATLNQGANLAKLDSLEWIYINDDLPTEKRRTANHLELRFKDKFLISFIYYWKPERTPEQISKAKEIHRQSEESLEQQERENAQ